MTDSTISHFGVIRHAPTLWNEQKRIQGQSHSDLSDRGLAMARTWGKELGKFEWNHILCSDLERVQQTAELINRSLHLPIYQDTRLREQDWGTWSGMTLTELKTQDRDLVSEQEQKGWDFRPPGGESRREVLARSMAALIDFHSRSHEDRNILVLCHEGVIKCLLYHLLRRQFLPEEPKVIRGYNLHRLAMQHGTLSLERLNTLALTSPSMMSTGR